MGARRGEELHRLPALLARAVARGLGTAERHVIIDAGRRQIDHDHAGLAVLAEMTRVLEGGGEDPRGQAEAGVIGDGKRVLVIIGC